MGSDDKTGVEQGVATAASAGNKQTPGRSLTRGEWLALAGVLIGTLLTFASTFAFGWVYDDPPQIPQNQNLQWGKIGFLFTHQLWASVTGIQGRFYRPLLTLWFLVNKSMFGLNPHWFHVTSVLAHVAATALAFLVARELLRNAEAALFAAATFGLHPLQAESASWISSANDPLAAIFCFSSFLLYRRAKSSEGHRAGWWALAGILFLLALLTKEVSVVLPGIVLVDLWADSRRDLDSRAFGRPAVAAVATYGAAGAVWFVFRWWVMGGAATAQLALPWSTVLLSAPKIVLFNLYRVVWPTGLSPQYDFRLIASPGPELFLFLFILLVLAGLALVAARLDRRLWTAFAWLALPMLPTLNLRWMNQHDFIHDRYMYMSMLGVGLLAGSAYAWTTKRWPSMRVVRLLAWAVVVMLAFASAIQSEYWANDVILFARGVQIAPANEWAQLNYGSALSARGKFADAAPHFVQSYELAPGWRAADFAGFAFQQAGDLPRAERWFATALQLNPTLANAWFGLGQISLAQHKAEDAITYFQKALTIQPDAEGYYYALGNAFEQLSRPADAVKEYQRELQLYPSQIGARRALERLQSVSSK